MSEERVKSAEELSKLLDELQGKYDLIKDAELKAIEAVGDKRRLNFEQAKLQAEALRRLSLEEQAALSENGDLQQDLIDKLKEQAGLTDEQIERINSSSDKQKEILRIRREGLAVAEKENELGRKHENILGGIASKIGIGNSALNKRVDSLTEQLVLLQESEEEQKAFNQALAKTFSLSNVLGSILESIAGYTVMAVVQVDKLQSSFSSLAGTGETFDSQMASVARNSLQFGINAEIAGEAFTSLQQNLIGFNKESVTSIENLTMQVGQLKRFGIEADLAVGIINDLNAVLGVNAEEAAEMTKQIAMSAVELGIGPKMMADSFRKASAVLAVHGAKSIDVFKGLAVAARNAGTSVDTLLSIANKFDTFSDAADAAGRLNSILGSTMSATEMLMMTEDERIETLIKTVNGQGMAFREMDRFTQKAIAQAAGINDMAEANRIFGMSLGTYRQQAADAKAAEMRQQKYNEAVRATVPIQEKLTEALQQLAANSETINLAIDSLVGLIDAFAGALAFLGPDVTTVIAGLMGLSFIGIKVSSVFGVLSGVFSIFGKTNDEIGDGIEKTGKKTGGALDSITQSAAKGKVGLLALGKTVFLIGAGFGLAAAGAGLLVAAFGQVGDNAGYAALGLVGFTVAFGALIVGLTFALPALGGATVSMTTFGIAVGVVGAAFAGVALAAAKFLESLQFLKDIGPEAIGVVSGIGKAIGQAALDIANIPSERKVQLSATLQNLALISSGQAAAVESSALGGSTVVQVGSPDVNNNLKVVIEIDGEQFDARIRRVANEDD